MSPGIVAETPREISPYNLIQEQLRDDPWKLLVAVIMLNQTSAKQARPVWERFFERFPIPEWLYAIPPDEAFPLLEKMFRPIGFQKRRTERIWLMTEQFLFDWDGEDPMELHGIGKYGSDSYRIFVKGECPLSEDEVGDKELKNYVRWVKSRKEEREPAHGGGDHPDREGSPDSIREVHSGHQEGSRQHQED